MKEASLQGYIIGKLCVFMTKSNLTLYDCQKTAPLLRHLASPNPSQLPHDQKIVPGEVKDSSAKTKGSNGVLLFLTKLTFGQQHPPVLLVLASAPQDKYPSPPTMPDANLAKLSLILTRFSGTILST
ncbi:hypothetical protein NC653_028001 [Populus alba x Populus x berolinensis]|uniref:Uncharacterized protein n=1 Tax=Populus alba x Populus x berolinensis TaxID=444605 RepID=A0AAD6M7B3_9ROSI|nr:hypothetical protein NC653_028001 [Populus alba x Populus x berolinensis]